MPASAYGKKIPLIDSIHLDWGTAIGSSRIEDIRARAGADTAVLYLLLSESCELRAIAAQSAIETRVRKASSTIGAAVSYWIDSLDGFAQGRVAEDPFLERFPEAMQHRLKQLAIFPLRHISPQPGGLLGLLVLGRAFDGRFGNRETEAAQHSAEWLAGALAQDTFRSHVSERLWIERAREILRRPEPGTAEQSPPKTTFQIAKEAARA